MLARRLSRIGLKTNSISIKKKEIVLAEGREKGAREGRKDGRKKETKVYLQNVAKAFQFTHVTFEVLQDPENLQVWVTKCRKHRAVHRF